MGLHTDRVVVLVDMDCFYCQVEEQLDPSLAGKPIAVVQYNAWKGGGLIAVNYLARDKGVTRHMRGDEAQEKCPDIVLVRVPSVRGKADLTKYREGGKRVADVLQTFSPLLQRASVDEAYLDITQVVEKRLTSINRRIVKNDIQNTYVVGCDTEDFIENIYTNDFNNEHNLKLLMGGVIVEEMRAAVYEKTEYRCSAGVAHNKILAKLACGMNKPNKQTLLPHESVEELYRTLSIKKIKSLGGKFGSTLTEDLKITYMGELAKFSEKELMKKYDDKTATWLYNIARGIDLEPVEIRLISKSIGCCKNFPGKNALLTVEDVTHWLSELSEEISERLQQDIEENNRRAKQMVISFAQEVNKKDVHSSRTITLNSYDVKKITEDAYETLKKFTQKPDGSFGIKFLGLSAGKFESTKNVNNILNFFKNINKEESHVNKEEIRESQNKSTASTTKSIHTVNDESHSHNNKKNQPNNNISEENDKKGILSYFDKNSISPTGKSAFSSSSTINKNTKKESFLKNFLVASNENKQDNFINNIDNDIQFDNQKVHNATNNNSVIEEELNLGDIENDAEISIETNIPQDLINNSICNYYSDSTVEMDFSEALLNKKEFPYRNTDESSNNVNILNKSMSPVLGESNSFFMRYIKKADRKSNEEKTFNPISIPSSSRDFHSTLQIDINSSDSNSSIQIETSQSNIPLEVIYSDNSDNINDNENLSVCPECEENIPTNIFIFHMDHHMALKLMEEERKLFKENFELEKQKKLNKSPIKEKISKSKSAKSSKPVKRKLSENKGNITSFFVQKTENDVNSEVCEECGKHIEKSELLSHQDFHAAKKLHQELNPMKTKTVAKPNKKMKTGSVNSSITNFFK